MVSRKDTKEEGSRGKGWVLFSLPQTSHCPYYKVKAPHCSPRGVAWSGPAHSTDRESLTTVLTDGALVLWPSFGSSNTFHGFSHPRAFACAVPGT